MAKKKEKETVADTTTAQISFKLPADLKTSLIDLACLSRRDVTSLLNELASELVNANRARIARFRKASAQPLKMPSCSTTPAKTAEPLADEKESELHEEN